VTPLASPAWKSPQTSAPAAAARSRRRPASRKPSSAHTRRKNQQFFPLLG
jgi:hypothetical protein